MEAHKSQLHYQRLPCENRAVRDDLRPGNRAIKQVSQNILKRRYALLFLYLSAISVRAADTFTINGNEITVPPPQGFVRITDEMTAVKRFVDKMADPMNDTLAYYIAESDVPMAMAGEIPALERTFILKVNKQLRNVTVGRNDFSQLKEITKSENQKILAKVKSIIPEHMKKISQGMSHEFDVDVAMDIYRWFRSSHTTNPRMQWHIQCISTTE